MRIGVITTGGDAPGMNAAIRAVVRYGISCGFDVVGIQRGYSGLLEDLIIHLDERSVGGIMHLGGTFLKTARSPEFKSPEGIRKGADVLKKNNIDGLVVIGGTVRSGAPWNSGRQAGYLWSACLQLLIMM